MIIFERFNYVNNHNKFRNTYITTSNFAWFPYQAVLLCALQSLVWCCIWMGNSSKSTFLHVLKGQQNLEF